MSKRRSAMSPTSLGRAVWLCACATWVGCTPAPSTLPSPKLHDDQQTTTRVRADPLHPLLIEWPAAERARLESHAERGVVAVRYDGSSLEVITTCSSDRKYAYAPNTLHRDRLVIESRDELGAQLPLSVATLGGKLAQHGRLVVDLALVGTYTLDGTDPSSMDFQGDCARVTHFVSGIGAGAFELRSGSGSEATGGAKAAGVGVEGGRQRKEELLSRGGDVRACDQGSSEDEHPPSGCGAFLRLELTPFKHADAPLPSLVAPPPSTASPYTPMASPPPLEPAAPAPRSEPFAPAPESPPPAAASGGTSVWAFIIPGSLIVIGVVTGIVIAATKKDDEPARDPVPQGGLGNTTLNSPLGVRF